MTRKEQKEETKGKKGAWYMRVMAHQDDERRWKTKRKKGGKELLFVSL
jgi:hypothetical protein